MCSDYGSNINVVILHRPQQDKHRVLFVLSKPPPGSSAQQSTETHICVRARRACAFIADLGAVTHCILAHLPHCLCLRRMTLTSALMSLMLLLLLLLPWEMELSVECWLSTWPWEESVLQMALSQLLHVYWPIELTQLALWMDGTF